MLAVADVEYLPLPDRSVNLVFGSPPYCDARTYGIGAQRNCAEWVSWMLRVTTESLRVSKGAVVWVAASKHDGKRNYWPACEGLMWLWWMRGGSAYRPCFYRRHGIPGSGGDQWFRGDTEYVMCFKRPGKLPWSDNTACGHPPKCAPGGAPSHRLVDGCRVCHEICRVPRKDGTIEKQVFVYPERANPGNVIDCGAVGGGNIGHKLAHENEAPMPEKLAERFVLSLCPPGGIVLDPFCGSGTTLAIAQRYGRRGIGFDIRASQINLTRRRLDGNQLSLLT